MGDCKFCGGNAGILRTAHLECARRYKRGKDRIVFLVWHNGMEPNTNFKELKKEIASVAVNNFVRDKELQSLHVQGWARAVRYSVQKGIYTARREKKLLELADQFSVQRTGKECRTAWLRFEGGRRKEKAKEAERERQRRLEAEARERRAAQEQCIQTIAYGYVPPLNLDVRLPFNFMKSEYLVWLFTNIMYQETYRRSYWSRGERVFEAKNVLLDTGLLGITTKHMYFAGPKLSFRIRYDRIMAFQQYRDGLAVQKAAASAKPQQFITGEGDSWFLHALVVTLAEMV